MARAGFHSLDAVPDYVASIVCVGSAVFCEFSNLRGEPRLTVVRSPRGKAILELQKLRGGPDIYSVVTAFSNTQAHGIRIGSVR